MPVWTIREAVRLAQNDLVIQENATVELDDVPRYLFEFNEEQRAEALSHQLLVLKPGDLEDIFKSASYVDLPNQRNTGMIIHIKHVNNGPRRFEDSFATRYVMQLLAERYVSKQKAERDQFISRSTSHGYLVWTHARSSSSCGFFKVAK